MRAKLCGLVLVALLAACQNKEGGGGTTTATSAASPSQPGWLNQDDRKIIRLTLDVAAAEPTPDKRMQLVAGILAELEKGRLPASWTETMFIVSKASVPIGAKTMWSTLTGKPDLEPLVGSTCKNGQRGLTQTLRIMSEMKKRVVETTATVEGIVFENCKAKELGFLDEVAESHPAALTFALVAFSHLKTSNTLSPEEGNALRAFVQYFSEVFQTKRIDLKRDAPTPKP